MDSAEGIEYTGRHIHAGSQLIGKRNQTSAAVSRSLNGAGEPGLKRFTLIRFPGGSDRCGTMLRTKKRSAVQYLLLEILEVHLEG
jgi:hypothetical protein